MRRAVVLPLKSLAESKTRLADHLTSDQRQELFKAMAEDVVSAVSQTEGFMQRIVVTSDPALKKLALSYDLQVVDEPNSKGHSTAALLGIAVAISNSADVVALLPGDCPSVTPTTIQNLAQITNPRQLTIAPDRLGTGTNALAIYPPDAVTPSFGESSFQRHSKLALSVGIPTVKFESLELACDVDTADDLAVLKRELTAGRLVANNTFQTLQDLASELKIPA